MAENSQSRTARRKQKTNKHKNKKVVFKRTLLTIVIIGFLFLLSGIGLFAYYVKGAPDLDPTKLSDPLSSKIYDKDGNLVADLGSEKRTKIKYNDLPQVMVDAVVATEDSRFFEHMGIDFKRILAAAYANVTDGFGAEGASTITQQVVKRSFLSPEKSLKRKAQEAWLALKLDRKYSKEAILEMYLNKIYYANSIYGVGKASEYYFGKTDLKELTLPEAALLAGIPQRPNAYDPYDHPDLAQERKNLVLDLMVQHGKITAEEAEKAKKVKVEDMVIKDHKSSTPYDAFIEQVIDEVQSKVDGVDIYRDGIKIYTTLDPKAQTYVETLLSKDSPINYPDDEFQTGVVVLDTKTGEIRAIGGGRNRKGLGATWNYAIDGEGRQPGSTFKPVIDYGPAIEKLGWSTYHQIKDEEYSYHTGDKIHNWYSGYRGWVSIREALEVSMNIPALKTLHEVGLKDSQKFAEGLGIDFPKGGIVEADAIGGGTRVTPFQMAGAYSAFGNAGIYNPPHTVTRVVFQNEESVDLQPEPTVAMSEETAYMVTDMLKSVLTGAQGTGHSANVNKLPDAGKTGTTNREDGGTPDSWFNGYTTNYTISVWSGYPKPEQTISKGKGIPQEFYNKLMTELSKNIETKDFTRPANVVDVAVEKGTWPAKLPSEFTPKDMIIHELFLKQNRPTEESHAYFKLDPIQDLQAKYDEKKQSIQLEWQYDHKQATNADQQTGQETNQQQENTKPANVTFEIKVSINDQPMEVVSTTKDTKFEINNVEFDSTYTFEVKVISDENQDNTSDPTSIQVKVPKKEKSLEDLFDELTGRDKNKGDNGGTDGTNDGEQPPTDSEDGQTSGDNQTPTEPVPVD